jgi:division protein CdvB (Snf7/Vps24/ESCRT-III family)
MSLHMRLNSHVKGVQAKSSRIASVRSTAIFIRMSGAVADMQKTPGIAR